jgi:hypothetical protein
MATKKVVAALSRQLQKEYELNKSYLKNLTVDDLNNLSQALLEHYRKGGKPVGGGCTSMCCT